MQRQFSTLLPPKSKHSYYECKGAFKYVQRPCPRYSHRNLYMNAVHINTSKLHSAWPGVTLIVYTGEIEQNCIVSASTHVHTFSQFLAAVAQIYQTLIRVVPHARRRTLIKTYTYRRFCFAGAEIQYIHRRTCADVHTTYGHTCTRFSIISSGSSAFFQILILQHVHAARATRRILRLFCPGESHTQKTLFLHSMPPVNPSPTS